MFVLTILDFSLSTERFLPSVKNGMNCMESVTFLHLITLHRSGRCTSFIVFNLFCILHTISFKIMYFLQIFHAIFYFFFQKSVLKIQKKIKKYAHKGHLPLQCIIKFFSSQNPIRAHFLTHLFKTFPTICILIIYNKQTHTSQIHI